MKLLISFRENELAGHNWDRLLTIRRQIEVVPRKDLGRLRVLLMGFVIGLVVSGVTVFPLPTELSMLCHSLGASETAGAEQYTGALNWLVQVRDAMSATAGTYPFLFYGYDWMAFAHLVIAISLIGPLKDPVRNKWVLQWLLICCVLVIPLALICGSIRGIPFWWRLIDCSFGVVGAFPLIYCLKVVARIETAHDQSPAA